MGHRGGRGRVDVVQQDYASATQLKTHHHSSNDSLHIARAPVEGVDVDGKLRNVAAPNVVGSDPRVAQVGIAKEGSDRPSSCLLCGGEGRFNLGLRVRLGQPLQVDV